MSIQESLFAEIAEAIRQKGGTSDAIIAKDFAEAILALPEGGGSTGPVKAPKLTFTYKAIQHAECFLIHSDTELAESISLDAFTIEDTFNKLLGIVRNDALNFTISCKELQLNDSFKIRALAKLFINNNGASNMLSFSVGKHTIDDLYNVPIGLADVVKSDTYIDSGTYNVPVDIAPWNSIATSMSVTADGVLTLDRIVIKVNARDESLLQLSYNTYEMRGDTQSLKVRWRGLARYNTWTDEYAWEIFFVTGAIVICLVNQPPDNWTGEFTITTPLGTQTYELSAEKPFITFYCADYTYFRYNIVNEKLDSSKIMGQIPASFTLDALIESGTAYMRAPLFEKKCDDDTVSVPIQSWMYQNKTFNACNVSGNSWIGLAGYSELIKLDRRDAAVYSVYCILTKVTFNKISLNTTKIRWDGAAKYNASRDLVWDLYLFANGDAMIHLIKQSSIWGGVFSFCGLDYSISMDTPFVSFYRQNVEGTSWIKVNAKYDIANHNDAVDSIIETIDVTKANEMSFSTDYVNASEQFKLITDYHFDSVEDNIDAGKLVRLEINTEQFTRVDSIVTKEVKS